MFTCPKRNFMQFFFFIFPILPSVFYLFCSDRLQFLSPLTHYLYNKREEDTHKLVKMLFLNFYSSPYQFNVL